MRLSSNQLTFDLFNEPFGSSSPRVAAAVDVLASHGGVEARGAVFTRTEVVNFILDLAGYTQDQPLCRKRIIEPSFGAGDFLLPMVERLLAAWRVSNIGGSIVADLSEAIRAVELHHDTFTTTRATVIERLKQEGINRQSAITLVNCWLLQGDYLLAPLDGRFDFVIGNPPYVRQESIPAELLVEYRSRYQTMYDRADLYIPFIERSLRMLTEGGRLGFICADRWMKNRYGGPLRQFVSEKFHLKAYVDMVDTPAFHSEVIAYPAITIITREKPGPTRITHRPSIDQTSLAALAEELLAKRVPKNDSQVWELTCVTNGSEPWLLNSTDQMALLRRLEQQYPTLEETGCKVGIGVATGADKAFIGNFDALDVEPDRKLPLVTTRDIVSGEVHWSGQGVINPFRETGGLVDLHDFPRLRQYLEARKDMIASRHCAQKNLLNWYRTIDRINSALTFTPKLLIPDIKGEAHIVYERGALYPHHNLYYITSEAWDLKALQAILLSSVSRLFVATYSTKMRGGYLRFQAQYLRRIRVPYWNDISEELRKQLIEAAGSQNLKACNRAAFTLFGLTDEERSVLGGNGD
ncbi:MAG: N-6 DNA methylase [Gammaproteobacteria bacterium]|nr:N-6 DNA methylase [Gammaproteobacteria bacterium]